MPHLYKIHAMADGSRSSASQGLENSPTSQALRWGMPSVTDLIFVAILCALLFTPLSVRLLGDAGLGWHIRTGQEILASHSIPRVDSFSSSMASQPWFAWEWLYDVAVGYLDAASGLRGPVWFTAVVIATVFAALFRFLIVRGTGLLVALAFVLLALSGSMIHFLARPHVLSWLICVVWFWILDSSEIDAASVRKVRNSPKLWFLPVLMLLWVNVHGAFPLGFVLLGIFWLGALWTWSRLKQTGIGDSLAKISTAKRLTQLTGITILSAGASLINPYGWKLHAHIYSYLSNRFLMAHIEEFQSPNFHDLAPRCFLLLLLISVAALFGRGRHVRLSGALTVLFAIYAGLAASRNIPVAAILLTMVIAPVIPQPIALRGFFNNMEKIEQSLRGHVWVVLAVLLTLGIVAHGGRWGSTLLMDAHFDPQRMPVGAVDFIMGERIDGPILGPDYWGGYLIYRLFPRERVVIDDRHDFYGSEFLQGYLKMMHVEDGWGLFLKQTQPRCLVLPNGTALANMLASATGWRSIYADPTSIVFERDAGGDVVSSKRTHDH